MRRAEALAFDSACLRKSGKPGTLRVGLQVLLFSRPPSFWGATGYLRWVNSLLALALQEKKLRDDRESD